ncbi:MAG: JAB domain-containing protein [Oscillospiraceae bacterium]
MKKEKYIHSGHRERMKERFLSSGFSAFNECEILEFILYQVQPRIDTKQIAYQLLEAFGDLQSVLNADYDALVKVKGIGRTSAEYLMYLKKLYLAYCDYKFENFCLRSVESRQVYFMKKLQYVTQDNTIMIACLNDRMRVIECKIIPANWQAVPELDLLEMIKALIPVHCNQIIIAIKRPNGILGFCTEEIQFAEKLREYFQPLKMKLIDLILFVRGQTLSLESDTRI